MFQSNFNKFYQTRPVKKFVNNFFTFSLFIVNVMFRNELLAIPGKVLERVQDRQ